MEIFAFVIYGDINNLQLNVFKNPNYLPLLLRIKKRYLT